MSYKLKRRISCKEEDKDKEEAAAAAVWEAKEQDQAAAAFAPHVELESLTKEVFPAIRELARNAGVKG